VLVVPSLHITVAAPAADAGAPEVALPLLLPAAAAAGALPEALLPAAVPAGAVALLSMPP
jgi:hypothetical protein